MSTPVGHISQPPQDLAAFLLGEWSVARTINGGVGHFDGVAGFADDRRGGVTWRETGRLTLGEHTGDAWRSYRIAPAPAAGGWEVAFEDGRPFHPLDLRAGRCEVEHLCGADVYRGVYEVHDVDRLTVTWRVSGPAKDDALAGEYRRLRR